MINSFDLNRRIKATLKLFLLLMKILLICNVVACSGFYISYYLASNERIYTPEGDLCTTDCYWVMNVSYAGKSLFEYDEDFGIQYIYSLYWASTTMISIGYGDITPKNPSEVAFTIFIQFLSCLLYGYAINQIWSIIQELNAKKSKIHSRLNLINLYMRDKEISPELTSRVNAYLNNYYYSKNLREREI
jgi:potassium voltage-gated channel Eag-related subfamily H protein 1/potassium voltage-gated channel Eag-related subfamily H protein 5